MNAGFEKWASYGLILSMFSYSARIFIVLILSCMFMACREDIEGSRKSILPRPFIKEIWQGGAYNDAETKWLHRPGMAREIVKNNLLAGKKRSEVIEMLGEPDAIGTVFPNEIKYELEEIFLSNIDPAAYENLQITFNSEDKVEKVEIEFHKTGDWRE